LSVPRYTIATAIGSIALFAGWSSGSYLTTVDVVDLSSRSLRTTQYSAHACIPAAVSIKAFGQSLFAGNSAVVDIYHHATTIWTTSSLSEARDNVRAIDIGRFAFFIGMHLFLRLLAFFSDGLCYRWQWGWRILFQHC
jgi:hypothetical protein